MKLVLIDSNSLINRAFYAMPGLTNDKGLSTGGIYGFVAMLNRLISNVKPTHIVAAFDLSGPTFRHDLYNEYKALRKPMPDELAEQIPVLKELLSAMKIKYIEKEGYEADDLIGCLSKMYDAETIIVSGDKDVLQLVSDKTTVFYTRRGITDVVEYTPQRLLEDGLTPSLVTDLKGLMGDSSDNIPGVKGVGEKTAKALIAEYGDLDGIYQNIDSIKGKLKEKLLESREIAYFSKKLATICCTIDLGLSPKDIELQYPFTAETENKMIELGFRSLVNRFEFSESKPKVVIDCKTIIINTKEELQTALNAVKENKAMALHIGEGISFATSSDIEYRINLVQDLLSDGLEYSYVVDSILPILMDNTINKIVFDLKATARLLAVELNKKMFIADDILLITYVLDAGKVWANLEEMLKFYGYSTDNIASGMLSLANSLKEKLRVNNLEYIYYKIELPLIDILYDMENVGFCIDKQVLEDLDAKYSAELKGLTEAIYEYAGETFNINSPKQLGVILFDKLNLPTDKKKSTSADKLNYLAEMHPIVPLLLNYRHLSKLLSTYITGLKVENNCKLHTVYKQAVTTTGRLSSTEPNLQNIPIRTAKGKEIRRAFIASNGCKLITADYSQIELRLMAHFSRDEELIKAYRENKDIHTATAAKVFGVDEANVTGEMRRRAKAVNFGIIYGISDFGLSDSIGTSVKDAKMFIDKYFATYPAVKEYMEKAKQDARRDGYARSLFGRIRYIPELKSSNYNIRSFGERAAMNMPLQGSASDIIKIAMINVYNRINNEGLKAKMVLQVHDELIFDTPYEEVQRIKEILKSEMESVATLEVPLKVEVSEGDNWMDAK